MTTYILFLRLSYCLFACRIEKTMHVFSKIWRFAKVYTREICQPSHSRKLIPAKLNFEGRRLRKFVPTKVSTRETLYQYSSIHCCVLAMILFSRTSLVSFIVCSSSSVHNTIFNEFQNKRIYSRYLLLALQKVRIKAYSTKSLARINHNFNKALKRAVGFVVCCLPCWYKHKEE